MSERDSRDETIRRTVHLLLDMATAWDESTGQMPPGAFESVMADLSQVGAVNAVFDDEDPDDVGTVDASPLIGAVGTLLGLFIEYAAGKSNADRLTVINTIRETVDATH